MEQEQTPKDESHKAGGSMPDQPDTKEEYPTPAEPVAETEPAEDTGTETPEDENPVGGSDITAQEANDAEEEAKQAESEAKELDEDRAKAEGDEDQARNEEAAGEAETEGGERNE